MKLRRVEIRNYRGIQNLVWCLDSRFSCLVGPGDSTKTTILDAIGSVLSPRFNLSFTDADFFDCNTSQSIEITAAITDLPNKLIEQTVQGMNRSGIRIDGTLEHDPLDEDGVEECLLVRMTVDETLEPVWEVIRPDEDAGYRINATERSHLGFFRVGDFADTHLRWGRTSALTGVTNSKTDAKHAVVEAQRQARTAIAGLQGTPLHDAATIAQTEAVRLGSAPFVDLRPGLDPRVGSGSAVLVLHEGSVPLTNYGLGSRRLTSLAIQDVALKGRSIVAIDEVEHGLDPHRLLHLIRYLRTRAENDDLQVLITTHSPIAIEALTTQELFVVRSSDGTTAVLDVPDDLTEADTDTMQGVMRQRPSSLLARRVIVGEGATETGFLRKLLWDWDQERGDPEQLTAVTAGVAVSNGSGDNQAPRRARALAELQFPTMLVIDGDVNTNDSEIASAKEKGVAIVRWPAGKAFEDVVVEALPIDGVQELAELAVDEVSEESVLVTVASRLGVDSLEGVNVSDWISKHGDQVVRSAIASAAKGLRDNGEKKESRAWFKREDRGARVAEIVMRYRSQLSGTDLANGLREVKTFAYADAKNATSASDAPPKNDTETDGAVA